MVFFDSFDKAMGQLVTPSRGACGRNLIWQIDYSNDTVIITGTGDMDDYSDSKSAPWNSSWRSGFKAKRIIIDDRVTRIGEHAFINCDMTEIKIPEGVTSIGEFAFSNCERLKEVTIPYSVTSIGEGVFDECKSLERIYCKRGTGFESKLRKGNNARIVYYDEKPKPAAQIQPSTPVHVQPSTPKPARKPTPAPEKLRWKVEGKTLTVGGVREIKFYRYGDLPWVRSVDAIQEIVIEAGVEKISANAFSECTRLELLTIPASVKTIGDMAFTFCYCGNRAVNGGKNVIWSLDDGVLTFKKNPAAKFATNFSIGVVSWRAVEKNITGFKLEAGVVPKEKFFEWLAQRDNAAQISFA